MEEYDFDLEKVDPNSFTIPKLKSILSGEGVALSTQNEKKAYYVELFNHWREQKLKDIAAASKRKRESISKPPTSIDETPTKKPKETPRTSTASTSKTSTAKRKSTTRKSIDRNYKPDPLDFEEDDEILPKQVSLVDKEEEEIAEKKKPRRMSTNVFQRADSGSDEEDEKDKKKKATSRRKTIASVNDMEPLPSSSSASSRVSTSALVTPMRKTQPKENGEKNKRKEAIESYSTPVRTSNRPTLTEPIVVTDNGITSRSSHLAQQRNSFSPFATTEKSNSTATTPSDDVNEDRSNEESIPDSKLHTSPILPLLFLIAVVTLWVVLYGIVFNFYMAYPKYCSYPGEKGCIPDPRVKGYVNKALVVIEHQLKEKNGLYHCHHDNSKYLSESELRERLSNMGFGKDIFELALKSINDQDEDAENYDIKGTRDQGYFSESYILPWGCAVKARLSQFKWYFLSLIILGIAYAEFSRRRRAAKREAEQVQELVHQVNSLLQLQKVRFDKNLVPEPYFAVTHLRDYLFKPNDKKTRDRLWKQVTSAVASDTRIQSTPILFHGEQQTVWQWTAPVLDRKIITKAVSLADSDMFSGMTVDEGSATAVEARYPGLFPQRTFAE